MISRDKSLDITVICCFAAFLFCSSSSNWLWMTYSRCPKIIYIFSFRVKIQRVTSTSLLLQQLQQSFCQSGQQLIRLSTFEPYNSACECSWLGFKKNDFWKSGKVLRLLKLQSLISIKPYNWNILFTDYDQGTKKCFCTILFHF